MHEIMRKGCPAASRTQVRGGTKEHRSVLKPLELMTRMGHETTDRVQGSKLIPTALVL